MLDVLSGGRLDLGAGRGATAQEMSLCGVDPARTYAEVEEALRLISSAWATETFEWHGEALDIEPPEGKAHTILPRPVQHPHPPLYMACTKDATITLAADYGVGALVLGFAGPDEVLHLHRRYRDAVDARSGDRLVSSVKNDWFSALCPTIVLDDREEALRIGARGQRFFAEAIAHWYGGGAEPAQDTEEDDNLAAIRADAESMVARLHEANIPVRPNALSTFNPNHAYGDADDAIGYVEQLAEGGVDEIMCLIQMGTVPQEVCLETIRQWGDKVIPHFRRSAPAGRP
jgi:alkanesulfonate monooxygenase SsuD/methylene tetrahydromethanopterin reductase-like flavin-dependent oxidoreductase (luciferase family)